MRPQVDHAGLLIDLGRYADAEKAAVRAIADDPDSAYGYLNLARSLAAQGKLAAAEEAARSGLGKEPEDARSHIVLAWILSRRSQYSKGASAALEAIRLDSDNASTVDAFNQLSFARYGLRQYELALDAALCGLSKDPTNASLLCRKAWAEYALGRTREGFQTAGTGLSLHPNNADLHQVRGYLWWQPESYDLILSYYWGHQRLAAADFTNALRLDPLEPTYRCALRGVLVQWRRVVLALVFAGSAAVMSGVLALLVWAGMWTVAGGLLIAIFLFAIGGVCLVSVDDHVLAFPLEWVGVPTFPMGEAERSRCLGEVRWVAWVLVFHAVALGILVTVRGP